MKIVLFLLFVIACVVGQAQNPGDVELLIIDDFSLGQNDNGVRVLTSQTIVEGQDPPVSATDSFNGGSTCSGLVACIRDLSIEVTNSFAGRSFTANIYAPVNNFDGEFSISTSKGGHSTTIAQYDGVFGFTSPPSNFMMVDLTVGNSNPYFFLSVFTDLQSSVFIDVRDTQAQLCTHEISVSAITAGYQIEETYYYVDFQAASFSGCDMTQISSIELRMPYTDSVDAIIKRFSVYGPVPPTNSLSATPTRTFTPSRTPTQSITSTPSRSPTPSTSPSFLSVPSLTPILSASPTPSTSPVSASPSTSPIRIPSASRTPAASPSSSITPTASVSKSRGATPSRTPSASPICVNCARESRVIDTVEEPVAVAVGATEVVAPPGSLQVGETLIVTDAGNSQSQNVPLPPGEISGDVVIIDLVDESGNEAQPSGPIDICITPEPNPPDDLCLAFQSNGAWLCEDDSPVLTNGQYCGVSNHFTIFALVSKRSIPDPIGPAPGDRSSFSSVRDSSTTYAFQTSFFNTFQTNGFTSAFTSSPSDSSDGVSMISFLSVGVVTLFLVALC